MIEIWQEFVAFLRSGHFPIDRIQSYHPLLQEPLLRFVNGVSSKANWDEWEAPEEVYKVDKQVHFLLPLTFDGQRGTYCFSFAVDEKEWYFQHMESITIRLDQISSLPTSVFPDIAESQKAWIREEVLVSEQIRLFNQFANEKGKAFAFQWFQDGAGYVLAAKSWVPFMPIERAFILYLCWEQANLRGNEVVLEKLADQEALVKIIPIYFKLYQQTGHIQQLIHWDDYCQLFEVVWQDRAKHAGWKLVIEHDKDTSILHFTR
jgi:hypothetical protein